MKEKFKRQEERRSREEKREDKKREEARQDEEKMRRDKIERENEEKMKRREKMIFFQKKCFRDPQTRQMNQLNMFQKKSPSDELFLHFFFESSESDRVFNFSAPGN